MIYITRRERFSAAHKLSRDEWSEKKNNEIFGKCSNPNWHGHNYTLQVTVGGEVDPITGFVIDLSSLSDLIKEKVIKYLDHKNINKDVPFMQGIMTSTENIAIAIWEQLDEAVKNIGGQLHKIKLQETENNFVEYYGGK